MTLDFNILKESKMSALSIMSFPTPIGQTDPSLVEKSPRTSWVSAS